MVASSQLIHFPLRQIFSVFSMAMFGSVFDADLCSSVLNAG
jgi:hypothetical protein